MEMEIRQRNIGKEIKEEIKNDRWTQLDVFTKVPRECAERSLSGGTVSIITFTLMIILIMFETWNYIEAPIKFMYEIDKDHDSKLRINIDMTIAMPCKYIGADVVDTVGSTFYSENEIVEEDVNFELTDEGKMYYNALKSINNMIREEYSSLQRLIWNKRLFPIWKSMDKNLHKPLGEGSSSPACRLHGSIFVRKVPGNFHIIAGKPLDIGFISAHAHLTGFLRPNEYNFSHRIHHFSFGDPNSNIANPLDAEQVFTTSNFHMFQYFIQVVSTRVSSLSSIINTYQYAVTEQNRTINHDSGSHGTPGIFMRYDVSPLLVNVLEDRSTLPAFLVRLAALVGGIYATSGFLHLLFSGLFDTVACKMKLGKYKCLPLDVKL